MAPLSALQRKLSHQSKEKVKRVYHVTVLSATGMSKSLDKALFVFARGDHAFESSVAEQELGSFLFNERVSQQVTLFRNEDESFEPKEYKLCLHQAAAGAKRGAIFAGGKIDLARYASQKTAKRVVLLLDPPSDAKSERKPVTVVLTVAAEGPGAGEAVPLEAFSPSEESEERSPPSDEDDDEDDSAPKHRGRGPHAPPASRDDDDEDVAASPGDHRVSTAKGARAKPLPAPPPPMQADEFDLQLQ